MMNGMSLVEPFRLLGPVFRNSIKVHSAITLLHIRCTFEGSEGLIIWFLKMFSAWGFWRYNKMNDCVPEGDPEWRNNSSSLPEMNDEMLFHHSRLETNWKTFIRQFRRHTLVFPIEFLLSFEAHAARISITKYKPIELSSSLNLKFLFIFSLELNLSFFDFFFWKSMEQQDDFLQFEDNFDEKSEAEDFVSVDSLVPLPTPSWVPHHRKYSLDFIEM